VEPARRGQAASRWPPANLDSSYAPRIRQLARNREKTSQPIRAKRHIHDLHEPWLYDNSSRLQIFCADCAMCYNFDPLGGYSCNRGRG
jgi:hypothetical protein